MCRSERPLRKPAKLREGEVRQERGEVAAEASHFDRLRPDERESGPLRADASRVRYVRYRASANLHALVSNCPLGDRIVVEELVGHDCSCLAPNVAVTPLRPIETAGRESGWTIRSGSDRGSKCSGVAMSPDVRDYRMQLGVHHRRRRDGHRAAGRSPPTSRHAPNGPATLHSTSATERPRPGRTDQRRARGGRPQRGRRRCSPARTPGRAGAAGACH